MSRLTRRSLRTSMLLLFAAALTLLLAACGDEHAPDGAIYVIRADSDVGVVLDAYLDHALDRAERDHAKLAVIELDTPGGLDSSMRSIVQRIEAATVPVAVYVSPSGGRAASAGTFITMAAPIAAMAPNTSIGAASAINADGSDIGGTLGRKVENDAVSFIRGIAELRGRNADWAEQAVRDAVSATQSQALELHVIDYIANDLDDLLRQLEGKDVTLRPGTTVHLEGLAAAPHEEVTLSAWDRVLDVIADPTVASLLLLFGFVALFIELLHPGFVAPGTIGLIAIVLGFLGFDALPVSTIGVVLIVLGFAMIGLEVLVPGGILGASGAVAILLGGFIAFRDTPADLRPNVWLLVFAAVVLAAAFGAMALLIARVKRIVATTGTEALVGKIAIARTPLAPDGFVFIQGERWQAALESGSASAGEPVRIIGADGLRLRVRKEETT
jgi:membrane-bound serine protease (ClpP class)